jgi:hypothetical protein
MALGMTERRHIPGEDLRARPASGGDLRVVRQEVIDPHVSHQRETQSSIRA